MAAPEQPNEPPQQSLTLAELFHWLTGKEPTAEELNDMREACERINARLSPDEQKKGDYSHTDVAENTTQRTADRLDAEADLGG
jgi:hypothetical protein